MSPVALVRSHRPSRATRPLLLCVFGGVAIAATWAALRHPSSVTDPVAASGHEAMRFTHHVARVAAKGGTDGDVERHDAAAAAPAPVGLAAAARRSASGRMAPRATGDALASKGLLKVLGAGGAAFADTGGAAGAGIGGLSGSIIGEGYGHGGLGERSTSTGRTGARAGYIEADGSLAEKRDVAARVPLRAGTTDDNKDFDEFIRFRKTWERKGIASADFLDVQKRTFIRVTDTAGRPVPAARVQVGEPDADRSAWTATTYGDGRTPFYPRVARVTSGQVRLSVEAWQGDRRVRAEWDGATDLSLVLPGEPASPGRRADVLFLIDTTGSMQDEINRIKGTLTAVNDRLKHLGQDADLRYGAILFRDRGDAYVTKSLPFTSDVRDFSRSLEDVKAGGGGDEAESVNQALAEAVRAPWRDRSARVVFLVGDAPPHLDYEDDTPYHRSLLTAVAEGIRVHAIAASGLNSLGTLVWRQVAQFTRGKFIFIEYGSTEATAASHGVTGRVASNNLDAIIFQQVQEELRTWGRDDTAQAVARR